MYIKFIKILFTNIFHFIRVFNRCEPLLLNTRMEKYQLQLEQVDASLKANPTNTQLLQLKEKLEQLLSITKQTETKPKTEEASTAKETPLSIGESCEVFLVEHTSWRPGRVISVLPGGAGYIVEVLSDKSTRKLDCGQVRRMRDLSKPKAAKPTPSKAVVQKRPLPVQQRKKPVEKEPEGPSDWKKFSQKLKSKK